MSDVDLGIILRNPLRAEDRVIIDRVADSVKAVPVCFVCGAARGGNLAAVNGPGQLVVYHRQLPGATPDEETEYTQTE